MRILRQRQVIERVGYSPMHIWRLEKAGRFPRRLKLGANSVGWLASEIDDWITARVADRDARLHTQTATTQTTVSDPPDTQHGRQAGSTVKKKVA